MNNCEILMKGQTLSALITDYEFSNIEGILMLNKHE